MSKLFTLCGLDTPGLVDPFVFISNSARGSDGVGSIEATSLTACPNRRLYNHKVLKKIAKRGKISMGWVLRI